MGTYYILLRITFINFKTLNEIKIKFLVNKQLIGKRKILSKNLFYFKDGPTAYRLSFGLTAKLAIASCFNVLFLYCAEIFPTSMRNVACGASSSVARIGSIVAPFINLAVSYYFGFKA